MKIETADTLEVLAGPKVSGLYKVAPLIRDRADQAKILLSSRLSWVRGQLEEQASAPPSLRNSVPKPVVELGPHLHHHTTTADRDSEADTGLSTGLYQDTTFPQPSRMVTPSRTGMGTSTSVHMLTLNLNTIGFDIEVLSSPTWDRAGTVPGQEHQPLLPGAARRVLAKLVNPSP